MSVGTIILIILVIVLLGGFSGLGGGPFYGTGYYGGGGLGLVIVILLILLLDGKTSRIDISSLPTQMRTDLVLCLLAGVCRAFLAFGGGNGTADIRGNNSLFPAIGVERCILT